MPLLRTMARTAVIAGTATTVSNRVSRRQYNKWSDQDAEQQAQAEQQAAAAQQAQQPQVVYAQAPPAPAPPAAAGDDRISQLKDLADLKAQGILTDEEFAAEKARVLGS
jgi:Short C-terminal domain